MLKTLPLGDGTIEIKLVQIAPNQEDNLNLI